MPILIYETLREAKRIKHDHKRDCSNIWHVAPKVASVQVRHLGSSHLVKEDTARDTFDSWQEQQRSPSYSIHVDEANRDS